jgi:Flp pilus assembly pilin Flp
VFRASDRGAAAVEYGLLVVLIAAAVFLAVRYLGELINVVFAYVVATLFLF